MRRRLSIEDLQHIGRGAGEGVAPEFAKYRDDPCGFARDILGVTLWSHQRRALEAIALNRRVSWRSSHGVGKSETAACAALWFTLTRPEALTIVTAPTARQVKAVCWRAIKRLHRNAVVPLGGEMHDSPEAGLVFPDGRMLIGVSAGDGERFAGLHAPSVLLIVDEASGVDQAIYDTAKGALTGDGRMLLIGNPSRPTGEFAQSHHAKNKLWTCLHTSAFDSPNVTGTEPAIPGLVDTEWIETAGEDYGTDSAVYQIRVLGEFPTEASNTVVSLALIEAATDAWSAFVAGGGRKVFHTLGRLTLGVDVARFGDDLTAIAICRGKVVIDIVTMSKLDVVQVAERVTSIAIDYQNDGERPLVRVDTGGIGGGVADVLRRNTMLQIEDIDSGKASPTSNHMRMRDALWFGIKSFLKDGGMIPAGDQRLEAELADPRYTVTLSQKLLVESKDETKKRLRRSPDKADAVALAVFSSPTVCRYFDEPSPLRRTETPTVRNGWSEDDDDPGATDYLSQRLANAVIVNQ